MLELRIDMDGLDYKALTELFLPYIFENEYARKAAYFTVTSKLSSMTIEEQNAFVCSFLSENKNAVIKGLNKAAEKKNIKGYVCNFDADII